MSSTLTQEECEDSQSNSPITYEADKFIISSPYPDHLLDLSTLDEPSQELAILLQELQPNETYLDLPYEQAFNWSTILPKLSSNFPATEFYVVAFHSRIACSSVNPEIFVELFARDKLSHLEANESGGLLKYWFGLPAHDGRNLATCVWTNRDCALKANGLVHHIKARDMILCGVYQCWNMEKYMLNVEGGKKWMFERIK